MEGEKINIVSRSTSVFLLEDNYNIIEPSLYIYKTLSFISWIFLLYSSLKNFYEQNMTYFLLELLNVGKIYLFRGESFAFPMLIKLRLLHTFITIVIIIGFINYIIYTIIKPNQSIEDGIFGKVSKLHFIPLCLVSTVFMMMENINPIKKTQKIDDSGQKYYECLEPNLSMNRITIIIMICLTILALIFLIIVYCTTKFNNNNLLVSFSIKKGVYSSLIVLMLHHIFNCIVAIKYIDILNHIKYQEEERIDFFNLARVSISPIFGFTIIIFSVIFKDAISLFINLLMYIGMLMNILTKRNVSYKEGSLKEFIIDIVMILVSLICLFIFVIKKFDEKLLS